MAFKRSGVQFSSAPPESRKAVRKDSLFSCPQRKKTLLLRGRTRRASAAFAKREARRKRRLRPKASGKTALFPRNNRQQGLKRNAFQAEEARRESFAALPARHGARVLGRMGEFGGNYGNRLSSLRCGKAGPFLPRAATRRAAAGRARQALWRLTGIDSKAKGFLPLQKKRNARRRGAYFGRESRKTSIILSFGRCLQASMKF